MAKKIKNSEIPLTLKDIKRIAASKGVKMENLHLYNPKHSLFGPLKPNELELGRAAAALEKLNQKQGGKSTGNTTTRGSNSGGTVRTVTTTQREPKGGSKYVPVAGTSDSLKTSHGIPKGLFKKTLFIENWC